MPSRGMERRAVHLLAPVGMVVRPYLPAWALREAWLPTIPAASTSLTLVTTATARFQQERSSLLPAPAYTAIAEMVALRPALSWQLQTACSWIAPATSTFLTPGTRLSARLVRGPSTRCWAAVTEETVARRERHNSPIPTLLRLIPREITSSPTPRTTGSE